MKPNLFTWQISVAAGLASAGVAATLLVTHVTRIMRAAALAAASGSLGGYNTPNFCGGISAWGPWTPPSPPPTSARLVKWSITPRDRIQVGRTLHVTAKTNSSWRLAVPFLCCEGADGPCIFGLHDDGRAGDKVPLDGNWTLDLPWLDKYGLDGEADLYLGLGIRGNYEIPKSVEIKLQVDPAAGALGPATGANAEGSK